MLAVIIHFTEKKAKMQDKLLRKVEFIFRYPGSSSVFSLNSSFLNNILASPASFLLVVVVMVIISFSPKGPLSQMERKCLRHHYNQYNV